MDLMKGNLDKTKRWRNLLFVSELVIFIGQRSDVQVTILLTFHHLILKRRNNCAIDSFSLTISLLVIRQSCRMLDSDELTDGLKSLLISLGLISVSSYVRMPNCSPQWPRNVFARFVTGAVAGSARTSLENMSVKTKIFWLF